MCTSASWGAFSSFSPRSPQGAPSGNCDVTACRWQHSLLTDTARDVFHLEAAGTSGDLQPKIRTESVGGKLLRERGVGVSRQERARRTPAGGRPGAFRPPGGRWGMRNWLDFGGYQTCRIGGHRSPEVTPSWERVQRASLVGQWLTPCSQRRSSVPGRGTKAPCRVVQPSGLLQSPDFRISQFPRLLHWRCGYLTTGPLGAPLTKAGEPL